MANARPRVLRHSASGIAMIMVVSVIAVAAVLGYAILSSSALQAQTRHNLAHAGTADYLAESGVNLATYYLQNPNLAPALGSGGYWTGGSGIRFGPSVDGSVDVTVTHVADNDYDIVAIGRPDGSDLSRRAAARVRVHHGLEVNHAAGFRSSITIQRGTRIMGQLQTPGLLRVESQGRVDGVASSYAVPIVELGGFLGGFNLLAASAPVTVPSRSELNDLRTYIYDGRTYQAVQLVNNTKKVLGPTPDNPAGVYWAEGNLRMPHGEVVVNGTLIVRNGNLAVRSGDNFITPIRGFPAIVVDGDVVLENAATSLEANGVVWIGGGIRREGPSNSVRFIIRGAMMFGGSGSIDPNQNGILRVEYQPPLAYAPILTSVTGQAPVSVTILNWDR